MGVGPDVFEAGAVYAFVVPPLIARDEASIRHGALQVLSWLHVGGGRCQRFRLDGRADAASGRHLPLPGDARGRPVRRPVCIPGGRFRSERDRIDPYRPSGASGNRAEAGVGHTVRVHRAGAPRSRGGQLATRSDWPPIRPNCRRRSRHRTQRGIGPRRRWESCVGNRCFPIGRNAGTSSRLLSRMICGAAPERFSMSLQGSGRGLVEPMFARR